MPFIWEVADISRSMKVVPGIWQFGGAWVVMVSYTTFKNIHSAIPYDDHDLCDQDENVTKIVNILLTHTSFHLIMRKGGKRSFYTM